MKPPYRERNLSLRGRESEHRERWYRILNPLPTFEALRDAVQYWEQRLAADAEQRELAQQRSYSPQLLEFDDVLDIITYDELMNSE